MTGEKFPGLDWAEHSGIKIKENGENREVFVNGRSYFRWNNTDEIGQRTAIVQLCELGLGAQEDIANVFGIHINSIYNYLNSYRSDGIRGLIDQPRGPRERWKVVPGLKAEILRILLLEGIHTYQGIQGRLERKGQKVSIESIRSVLIETGFVKERIEVGGDLQGELFEEVEKEKDDKQLEFSFTKREGNDKQINGVRIKDPEKAEGYKFEDFGSEGTEKKDRSYYSQTQRIYLDQLEQGMYNTYAGGLLFVPLLRRYNFLSTIRDVINIDTYEGYSLEELCLTLFYFDLFRFESMENFKTAYPEEFGQLIGRLSSPSIHTLRRFLHKVKGLSKSEELIEEFAKGYLKSDIVKWGVLYIDSHFLPYHGIYCISMGWHGVRKIPMKGSYNFIAIDERFNPLLFLIRSSSEDLLQKIPEIIIKARKIAKDAGIVEEEIKDLVVIFDREGYSAELFRVLDGKDRDNGKFKTRFITWAKYTDKWVEDIGDEKFDKTVTVTYEIQDSEEIRYFETERVMKKYGKIRAIVIESGRDKKRTAIYTNDREGSCEIIVQLICRRWGQENLIKELMYKHEIEYSPGYEANEIEDQPMVENPKVNELKQKVGNLKGELSGIKSKFGHEVLEEMEKEARWEEIKEKRILTIADIEGIRSQITLLEQEIDKLPKEVKFDEAHGKKLHEFNYEKKRFLDCIKVFTYNIEKQMCNLLLSYYPVKKEIYPVLAMIVKRGGFIKLEDRKLKIQLRGFKNPEIDDTARRLCEDLNQMKIFSLDKFHLPIRYEVL